MPISEFLGLLLLVFLTCVFVAYSVGRVLESGGKKLTPLVGGVVRIKCAHGVYRSRFLGLDPAGWRLSAPLSRDSYVPFRPGESVVLEAPLRGSSVLARSQVVQRDLASHELVVARPKKTHKVERRETRRMTEDAGLTCTLEGVPAALVDVSGGGARLVSRQGAVVGERVRIDLPWTGEPVFAWVIEVAPTDGPDGLRTACRVRFEEPVVLPKSVGTA